MLRLNYDANNYKSIQGMVVEISHFDQAEPYAEPNLLYQPVGQL
jgi:hypothetical protein